MHNATAAKNFIGRVNIISILFVSRKGVKVMVKGFIAAALRLCRIFLLIHPD
jgi:hypothetical protein